MQKLFIFFFIFATCTTYNITCMDTLKPAWKKSGSSDKSRKVTFPVFLPRNTRPTRTSAEKLTLHEERTILIAKQKQQEAINRDERDLEFIDKHGDDAYREKWVKIAQHRKNVLAQQQDQTCRRQCFRGMLAVTAVSSGFIVAYLYCNPYEISNKS